MNATRYRERSRHGRTLLALLPALVLAAFMRTDAYVAVQQSKPDQPSPEASRLFEVQCAACHGNDGRGAERGPDIVSSRRSLEELERIIRSGIPAGGMPPTTMSSDEVGHVARHVRAFAAAAQQPRTFRFVRLRTRDGRDVEGLVQNESNFDIQTGKLAWEYPQLGPSDPWGGVISTATGLVFFCEDGGGFTAVDARTGKLLWHFPANTTWRASPMTYMIDGQQFVAVAGGGNVFAFGL